jgi:glycosyltransferase involved in cell wall biosynthesis
MKIAFDISSTQTDNKFRGIGSYTLNLKNALQKQASQNNIEFVPFSKNPPQADLYHFPAFNPFFFSFPFSLINKTILTIHDLIPLQYPNHFPSGIKAKLRWKIQRYLIKNSKHIITDSIASKKIINKITGIPNSKITPIYLAANSDFKKISNETELSQIVKKHSLPPKFVLYVGDFNWNKNVMLLAKVAVNNNYPLVVVGKQAINQKIDSNHPWNKDLVLFQNFAKDNPNLIKRLGFLPTDELVALYNLATVFVCPSIAEGFGLPSLEAMSCGCPVISSSTSSLPEVVGQAALYFDPFSEKELTSTLKKVWENETLRNQLSQKGLEQSKKFSWESTARETIQIYKKYE